MGIIGGADGTTAIIVCIKPTSLILAAVVGFVALVGLASVIYALYIINKRRG